MNARTAARLFAALAIASAVSATASGCASPPAKPSEIPIQQAVVSLPSGTIPGLEFVDVGSLPMGQKANIDGWEAAGATLDSAPTLVPKTYKPVIGPARLQVADVATDTSNGIALKVVKLTLDPAGTKAFAAYTAKHIAGSYAIAVNGKVLALMAVREPVTNGQILVSNDPAVTEELANAIVPK